MRQNALLLLQKAAMRNCCLNVQGTQEFMLVMLTVFACLPPDSLAVCHRPLHCSTPAD